MMRRGGKSMKHTQWLSPVDDVRIVNEAYKLTSEVEFPALSLRHPENIMENNIPWPNLYDVPSPKEVYERFSPMATFEKMFKKMLQEERLKTV
ncbi:unnamed protein product [Arabis nemorensis]|uniref:Uncharacterized protein n=1 Tax=Arabis nemorensis TaxID=586526 RepID=A0A565CXA2_9BRAS|nr:unnamed protein product [Arabis nemorensis]